MGSIAPPQSHLLERPNDRRKVLLEKYAHLLKKGGNKVSSDVLDPFRNPGEHDDNYQVIFEEMDRLKESETEAREEVLRLENFIRQSRMLQKLRSAVDR